jgi:hypothetical protein
MSLDRLEISETDERIWVWSQVRFHFKRTQSFASEIDLETSISTPTVRCK